MFEVVLDVTLMVCHFLAQVTQVERLLKCVIASSETSLILGE